MKLSVVIPAHNEDQRIERTLVATDTYLEKQDYDYEIIVVDNNSTDKTVSIVEELLKTSVQKARIISEPVPGKGAAVTAGMIAASGDFVIFMDADNATPISEIEKFWPHFKDGYSVVIGSRYLDKALVTKKQPFYRIVLSRLSNGLIQTLVLPGIKDTQVGFKAFTSESARSIFKQVTITGWGFDMEVLTVAKTHGYKIKEVPVSWHEFGGSHLPPRAYIESLKDLLRIKYRSLTGQYTIAELQEGSIA